MLGLFGGRGAATIAVAATLLVAVPVSAGADSADAPSGGAYLTGADRWLESDCAGVVPIVVGSDAKAQSDIYSAITLAGAIGTDCVVLAGARDAEMSAAQKQRLEAANAGGYVVGGEAAVPAAKIAGRQMTRIAGADRWITAQQVGAVAASNAGTTAGTGVVRLEGCHPAYEPCLPYYLSDEINCGDLDKTQKPVRVKEIGTDPYKLDSEKDGRGCES